MKVWTRCRSASDHSFARSRFPRWLTIVLVAVSTGGSNSLARAEAVCVPVPTIDDRCEAWSVVYPNRGADVAGDLLVAPRGDLVFAIGRSWQEATGYDWVIAAFEQADGRLQWSARLDAGGGDEEPFGMALNPDASRLFVTGAAGGFPQAVVTAAYDTQTGEMVWRDTFPGFSPRDDPGWRPGGVDVAVSPTGAHVYVTGVAEIEGNALVDSLTIAYDAQTGKRHWNARFGDPEHDDRPRVVLVSPDGNRVYVLGSGNMRPDALDSDFFAVAYEAGESDRPGKEVWTARAGTTGLQDFLTDATLSHDGSVLYLSEFAFDISDGNTGDYSTFAYDATTGARIWGAKYAGPAGSGDYPQDLAVSRDGARVFVTGQSYGGLPPSSNTKGDDFATVAYDAVSGEQLWVSRYDFYVDTAKAVVVDPDGSHVYVTGESAKPTCVGLCAVFEIVTVAYDAADGSQAWVARLNSDQRAADTSIARDIGISSDGSRIFVLGDLQYARDWEDPITGTNSRDLAVIAYDA